MNIAPPESNVNYLDIAQLHIDNIDQGFLGSLGKEFLGVLYRAINDDYNSCLLIAQVNNQIVGFIAGTSDIKYVYRCLLRYWRTMIPALAMSFFSPSRLKGISETFFFSYFRSRRLTATDNPCVLPTAELLSIVVDPSYRSTGVADGLYNELINFYRTRGIASFKITVGSPLARAHRFYQRKGAVSFMETKTHKGYTSIIYLHRLSFR